MTPDELRNCLRDIRWTAETMSDALGCDIVVVQDWPAPAGILLHRPPGWIRFRC